MKYEYQKGKWVPVIVKEGNMLPDISKIMAFEQGEMDNDEAVEFIQSGIDDGWVWKLQGFYGRTAMRLIEMGLCHPKVVPEEIS